MASLYDSASLVMIPSGIKEDKLFSIKPTDGSGDFTFSRGSDIQATRVNSSGLIEKAKVNLLLQSNTFDTTWTTTSSIGVTSGQSGYDGSSDAWLFKRTSGGGQRLIQTISNTGVQTISVYAKAESGNWLLLVGVTTGSDAETWFDLSGSGSLGGSNNTIDAKIESVGSGWYRCSVSYNATTTEVRIYPTDGNGSVSGTTEGIYIQDAQLNHGLIAQDYVETTTTAVVEGLTADLPRLDYSGGAICPSLLLEPSRTNLVPNSEHFAASTWSVTATLTANAGISPEGVQNAYNIAANSGLGNGITDVINIPTSGVDYTSTIYYKSAGATTGSWRLFDGSTGASTTITLEPTSEWKRAEITRTAGGSTTQFRIDLFNNDGDLLIYGAQLEEGSYPTSYIPTYGTAANRGADRAEVENGTSVLPTAYPFTLYAESKILGVGSEFLFNIYDRNTTNSYAQLNINAGVPRALCRYSGGEAIALSPSSVSEGTIKMAAVFTESNIKLFVNGELKDTEANTTPFQSAWNDSLIGQLRIVVDTDNRTTNKQSLLFNSALADADCIALTTI